MDGTVDTTEAEALLAGATADLSTLQCLGDDYRGGRENCPRCCAESLRDEAAERLAALAPEVTAWAIGAVKALEGALKTGPTCSEREGKHFEESPCDCCEYIHEARKALAIWDALRWGKEEGHGD